MPALLEKAEAKRELAEPFRWFDRMRDEIERLFETNGTRFPLIPRADTYWMPALEVFEKDGKFHVNAELPGMKKEDITLEATPEGLTLKGERKAEKTEEREGYYRSERAYGEFCRFVPIPEGADLEKLVAQFKDGVLEIAMPIPKAPKVTARLVDIK
jgi:HSP20 family protein